MNYIQVAMPCPGLGLGSSQNTALGVGPLAQAPGGSRGIPGDPGGPCLFAGNLGKNHGQNQELEENDGKIVGK